MESISGFFFSASGPKLNENKTQNSTKTFQKLNEIMAKTQFSSVSYLMEILEGCLLFEFNKTPPFFT